MTLIALAMFHGRKVLRKSGERKKMTSFISCIGPNGLCWLTGNSEEGKGNFFLRSVLNSLGSTIIEKCTPIFVAIRKG